MGPRSAISIGVILLRPPETKTTPAAPGHIITSGVCGSPAAGALAGRCGYGLRLPFLVISPWARITRSGGLGKAKYLGANELSGFFRPTGSSVLRRSIVAQPGARWRAPRRSHRLLPRTGSAPSLTQCRNGVLSARDGPRPARRQTPPSSPVCSPEPRMTVRAAGPPATCPPS
jgi:hypothetical protein